MFTSLSPLYFYDITLSFHNIVLFRRKTSILYVMCMQLMLYILCIFIPPSPTSSSYKKTRGESPLVSCLTSFRINGHQHHQDLVLHIRGHLISHLMLLHKYQHQDVLLVLLLLLLELQRYTLI